MRLSESEIKALVLVAGSKQALHPRDLSQALNLHPATLSRLVTGLVDKGMLERDGKYIAMARTTAAEAFKKLYFAHRASPFPLLLADRRVDLLALIEDQQKMVEMLEKESGIPRKTIYRYLKDFIRLGAVKRTKQGRSYLYSLNEIIWPEIKGFAAALQEYQALRLIPREALLIKSYRDNVLFKSIRPQDATFTSFSAYKEYGIELSLRDNYYTLPKRELSIQEVFIHSLDSAWEAFQKLFCVLFYLKNRDKLEAIDHPMVEDIKAVLQGERISGYPTLEDIKDRADLYDNKL
ncbi:MAG: helix-turn-helix domain-containing protein [Methanosarcinales archaeon]|nr:helix-turn-helix domain-containing protein [Methanosarcinales archaeon]